MSICKRCGKDEADFCLRCKNRAVSDCENELYTRSHPRVSMGFVEQWAGVLSWVNGRRTIKNSLIRMLREAGVDVGGIK